jgi:predicted GNAT superfamily acetyltransferase
VNGRVTTRTCFQAAGEPVAFGVETEVAVVRTGGAVVERRAADNRADLAVVPLQSAEHLHAAAELLRTVWQARTAAERVEVISTTMLRSLSHSGNYVAGVFDGEELIGCAVGWTGLGISGPPDHLHSDIAGVRATESNRGIGYAIKRHQRRWALDRGLGKIRWTFDPAVARNAYFNLCKLGATVTSFEPDFYGRLNDGVNTDQTTDRLVAEWDLHAPWVRQAPDSGHTRARRHVTVPPGAELISVPPDIAALRQADPVLAQRERLAVRERFQSLLARGYRVAGMSERRDYVLLPYDVPPVFEA